MALKCIYLKLIVLLFTLSKFCFFKAESVFDFNRSRIKQPSSHNKRGLKEGSACAKLEECAYGLSCIKDEENPHRHTCVNLGFRSDRTGIHFPGLSKVEGN